MQQIEDYKREFLEILFRQQKVILRVTIFIFIAALLIAFFWPPTYSASSTVLVRERKVGKSTATLGGEDRPFRLTSEDLASEEQILKSPDVIEMTIKYLKKEKSKAFTDLSNDIGSNLKTEIIPASNVIKVTLNNRDPFVATTILRTLVQQYLVYRMQVYNPSQSEHFFSQQVRNFDEVLASKGEELSDLLEKTKIVDPLNEIANNLIVKRSLEEQLNILENDAIENSLHIEYLEKSLKSEDIHFFSSINNPTINGLDGLGPRLIELVAEQRSILKVYHPSSNKVKAIEKQVKDAYLALRKEVVIYKGNLSNQLEIINGKIKNITNKLHTIGNRNVELRSQQINSQKIAEDAVALTSHVSILSKAFSSGNPVFPKKGVVIPLGLIIGFITACSLGFIREYFDHTFKKPSDVENYVGLPVIFSVRK
jgi:uncharacterized protein involved in exopolysaccharide biosynthesis